MTQRSNDGSGFARRAMLGGGLASVGLAAFPSAAKASGEPAPREYGRTSRTRLVLLGTAGGPPWFPNTTRAGISSAVCVGDRYYLVDAGHGVGHQMVKAKLPGWQDPARVGVLHQLRAIFLTHLHSDHVCDLNNIFTTGLVNGIPRADLPIKLFGPGDRGALPPLFGPAAAPPVVCPESPTPGTREMWQHLVEAFATDYNDRARDNRLPVPQQFVEAHDVQLPEWVVADPNGNPEPRMSPVDVYEDDRVKVSATLVQHAPVFPALAYRFDTDEGSIVFSGDTGPSENLVGLASNVDVLVHEVIAEEWVDQQFPEPRTETQEAIRQHLLAAHTTIAQVPVIAERANAKNLVLNHLAPANWPEHAWRAAQNGYSGLLIVGNDLDVINVGGGRKR
ncbi:MBL fold metallo-hydrolase [Micromonospora sp. NPDC048830]|uniref:MBL fold metallo-hydrolase n=1 Tax=Micromonospora sp. NPDC048830 TaxID=3364257 RepID=UPI0037165C54